MKILNLLLLTSLAAGTAHAGERITLEQRGDSVCRIKNGAADRCMPTLKSLGFLKDDSIEITDQLRVYNDFLQAQKSDASLGLSPEILSSTGGASLFSEAEIQKTLSNYRYLSVRLASVDPQLATTDAAGITSIPFTGSLYWKGAASMEGTIYVEGSIRLHGSYRDLSEKILERLENYYSVESMNDSGTEKKQDLLSFLEKGAREVHFRVIGTDGMSTDDATLALLKKTIAPMVFGQVMYVPLMNANRQKLN